MLQYTEALANMTDQL